MEFAQTLDIRNSRGFQAGWQIKCKTLNLIRYADDFVILHKDIKVVLQAKTIIQEMSIAIKLSGVAFGAID